MMAIPASEYSAEYNALIAMAEDLCNALPISNHDLLPRMISNRVISLQDKIEIRSVSTDRGKVQLLISKLTEEMALGENDRFYKFLTVMKKSPKCSFLVERMERWISHYKQLQSASPTEFNDTVHTSTYVNIGLSYVYVQRSL